ncbi:MAG: acyltransferase [Burkholderiaceae bacterium]|jgi:peptidoglycan/LPS O-acetylase OafA/YrhL|nr:acyltransferase [Burkholderiaceae bacterium]
MASSSPRSPWIDVLKGTACMAIVWHHLSVYGPLARTVWPLAPTLLAWLYDYARMAVQIFLVVGGYLAAASLAPTGLARFESAAAQLSRRFVRLAVPYAAALVAAVAVAALLRPWWSDPSLPGAPHWGQLLANAFMLQDLMDQSALSAGVWYVAIDLQLFSMATLWLALARRAGQGRTAWGVRARAALGPAGVLAGCTASLWFFNRDPALDAWGIYFFGSYGLGMCTYWATGSARPARSMAALALLAAVALALDFRPRLALAFATCALLAWLARGALPNRSALPRRAAAPLAWVGQRSYSVFLVHFPVCLAVNAAFSTLWPAQIWMHALGLWVAFAASILAGCLLYENVERPSATALRALRWQARLLGAGWLVAIAQSL